MFNKLMIFPTSTPTVRGNRSNIILYADYPCAVTKNNRQVFYKNHLTLTTKQYIL